MATYPFDSTHWDHPGATWDTDHWDGEILEWVPAEGWVAQFDSESTGNRIELTITLTDTLYEDPAADVPQVWVVGQNFSWYWALGGTLAQSLQGTGTFTLSFPFSAQGGETSETFPGGSPADAEWHVATEVGRIQAIGLWLGPRDAAGHPRRGSISGAVVLTGRGSVAAAVSTLDARAALPSPLGSSRARAVMVVGVDARAALPSPMGSPRARAVMVVGVDARAALPSPLGSPRARATYTYVDLHPNHAAPLVPAWTAENWPRCEYGGIETDAVWSRGAVGYDGFYRGCDGACGLSLKAASPPRQRSGQPAMAVQFYLTTSAWLKPDSLEPAFLAQIYTDSSDLWWTVESPETPPPVPASISEPGTNLVTIPLEAGAAVSFDGTPWAGAIVHQHGVLTDNRHVVEIGIWYGERDQSLSDLCDDLLATNRCWALRGELPADSARGRLLSPLGAGGGLITTGNAGLWARLASPLGRARPLVQVGILPAEGGDPESGDPWGEDPPAIPPTLPPARPVTPTGQVIPWGARLGLWIGGANRTADLIGTGEVDRELDAAGIAVVRLGWGSAKPAVGQSVTIIGIVRSMYVGAVSEVAYDPRSRGWVVTCSDGLQEQFESLPDAPALLAKLPPGAIWHADLHGVWQDGWSACQDAMSTIPWSIFMESGTLRTVPWTGRLYTSLIAHDAGGIYDGSVELVEANSRTLIRALTATVEIRCARRHHWAIDYSWTLVQPAIDSTSNGPPYAGGDFNFAAWLRETFSLPTRALIAQAVTGTDWHLDTGAGGGRLSMGETGLGITYMGLPPSGIVAGGTFIPMDMAVILRGCWPDLIWRNQSEDPGADINESAVIAASWRVSRNWTQSVVERVTLTVTAAAGTTGAALADEQASHDAPHDDAAWDQSRGGLVVPAGLASHGGSAHAWVDVIDGAERERVLGGMAQMLATRIRRSQRQTVLSVAVEPGAEPALGERVRVAAADIQCTGQVVALHTTWDGETSAARCTVRVAVGAGSTAEDLLTAPTRPALAPTGYVLTTAIRLGTHIGGHEASVAQGDPPPGGWVDPGEVPAWDGWVGNMLATANANSWGIVDVIFPRPGKPVYTEGFTVQTPDVPDAAREDLIAEASITYTIDPLAGAVTVTP